MPERTVVAAALLNAAFRIVLLLLGVRLLGVRFLAKAVARDALIEARARQRRRP